MATESDLQAWWDRLTDDVREEVKVAAEADRLDDPEVAQVLARTGCPAKPVDVAWGSSLSSPPQPGYAGVLGAYVRDFILKQ